MYCKKMKNALKMLDFLVIVHPKLLVMTVEQVGSWSH